MPVRPALPPPLLCGPPSERPRLGDEEIGGNWPRLSALPENTSKEDKGASLHNEAVDAPHRAVHVHNLAHARGNKVLRQGGWGRGGSGVNVWQIIYSIPSIDLLMFLGVGWVGGVGGLPTERTNSSSSQNRGACFPPTHPHSHPQPPAQAVTHNSRTCARLPGV